MRTFVKKNGKVCVEYKRTEKYSNPERFMTYAKVSLPDEKRNVLVVADYAPRKKNAAVAIANELYPGEFVYDYGMRVRFADNGVYGSQAELDASMNRYREMYKSIA